MDVHIPGPVAKQLRLRGIDVVEATKEKSNRMPDDELLALSTSMGRMLITYDHGFKGMAERWQREGRQFAGLGFAEADTISIGQMVRDLEILGKASDSEEWMNRILYFPLP